MNIGMIGGLVGKSIINPSKQIQEFADIEEMLCRIRCVSIESRLDNILKISKNFAYSLPFNNADTIKSILHNAYVLLLKGKKLTCFDIMEKELIK